jgi:hypothetical protein
MIYLYKPASDPTGFKRYSEGIFHSQGTQQAPRRAMHWPSLAMLGVFVNLFLLLAFRLSFDTRTVSSTYYLSVPYVAQSQIADIKLRLNII